MSARADQERKTKFAALLRAEQARLFGYIHALVRDWHDAEDIFQQVALVLWRKLDAYDASRSFLAWACGVARLEVSNFLRVRGRSRLFFTDALNLLLIEAAAELSSDETEARAEALGVCVGKLKPEDRELLERCYAEEADVTHTARERGRSSQSVHNSLRRIRRTLFECIRRTLASGCEGGLAS